MMFGLFSKKKETSSISGMVYSLVVGEAFPFGSSPQGGCASLSIGGILTHVEFMYPIDDTLVEAYKNKNITRSVYTDEEIGWPVYTLVFEPGRALIGMLSLNDDEIEEWSKADTNGMHVVLVDAHTNLIVKVRTLGLNPMFRLAITDALMKKPKNSVLYSQEMLNNIPTIDLLCNGRGWLWNDEDEEFYEVEEGGLRSVFCGPGDNEY